MLHTSHKIQEGKKSTQTWNFKVPHVETRFTTPKTPSFHDLGQKWWPKVGAMLGFQWRMEEKEKATWGRGRERAVLKLGWVKRERVAFWVFYKRVFSFLLFYFKLCHMSPFEWSKRPTFLLMWLMLSHMKRKIWPFEMPKSCLDLRAVSLVPVPRVSLRPSGPVFESRQFIYQNAQNKTPSMVQRLVLLNFKLHARWWFLD